MTTINDFENELHAFAKGAPEIILNSCSHILLNGKKRKITSKDKKKILKQTQKMASKALRVLAFASRTLPNLKKITPANVEKDLIFIGLVGMIDPPRAEVKKAVKLCRSAGIKTIMVTGDHELTAQAIAEELGFPGSEDVISGEEITKMDALELKNAVKNVSIFARVSPEHKVRILEALHANGEIVAMTGDGVNDAPALKSADIGVAMGIKGTDVAKEASDMVLEDDNFSTIVSAVERGRGIYANIKKFIALLLSGNIGEILVIALAMLVGFKDPSTGRFILPLIATQLLWINLLTDGLPAVALAMEPVEKDVMTRKPRDPKESIFKKTRPYILEYPIILVVGTLSLFAWMLRTSGVAKAQTVVFTSIVIFELFQCFACRSLDKPWIKLKTHNKYLLLAVALSLILQFSVLYFAGLQKAFHTVPLGLYDWIAITLVASTGFIYLELYKTFSPYFNRAKNHL
jgi:Ca2+-transporting ATPase